ncbi:MAG: tRNA (N6-isopentenyl adenosine(37)-C2)-methylthiotransferase MiaB [Spirochaetaceae bacterium]|nr:tRNA (N6-isopentenyl adenosine(37)-C2)-methylthiotransferase MiaB [Spirochaetaceae bacterium]
MTWFFETYGCQMNIAESAALEQIARERGWLRAASGETADMVLLNTCSVRATAEQRIVGRIGHYAAIKKKRKTGGSAPLTLVMAGCMAERLGERIKTGYPVDFVMGASSRAFFPAILEAVEKGAAGEYAVPLPSPEAPRSGGTGFSFYPLHLERGADRPAVRSFVPIMHGCDNFCSYCIVPYVRGREVSRPPREIRAEIETLAAAGIREITLLGQNVNSYRHDGTGFSTLLATIARWIEGTPIKWVRFLSANPGDFSEKTIRVLADHPAFCRHIHLCAQHGSNRILTLMNRRYTREDYLTLTGALRGALSEVSFSTDILVGFPGETEADFREILSLMEEVRFSHAYMYHYNPREGTAAFSLENRVPEEVKRERLSRVIDLQKKHTREILKNRTGRRETVLFEGISRKNADELLGRTAHDEMTAVRGGADLVGSFGEVTLAALRGNTFRGADLTLSPGEDKKRADKTFKSPREKPRGNGG